MKEYKKPLLILAIMNDELRVAKRGCKYLRVDWCASPDDKD